MTLPAPSPNRSFSDLGAIDLVKNNELSMEEASLNASCPDITMPTLLLWGRHDTLFPCETADFLKERIPNAKAVIFEDLGHVPHIEAPGAFVCLGLMLCVMNMLGKK